MQSQQSNAAPDDDLLRRIARKRNDPEFMGRLRRLIAENADTLQRLAQCDRYPDRWCELPCGHSGPCERSSGTVSALGRKDSQ